MRGNVVHRLCIILTIPLRSIRSHTRRTSRSSGISTWSEKLLSVSAPLLMRMIGDSLPRLSQRKTSSERNCQKWSTYCLCMSSHACSLRTAWGAWHSKPTWAIIVCQHLQRFPITDGPCCSVEGADHVHYCAALASEEYLVRSLCSAVACGWWNTWQVWLATDYRELQVLLGSVVS